MINVVISCDIEEFICTLFERTAFSCEDVFFNTMNLEDGRLFQICFVNDKLTISIKTEQKAKGLKSYYSINFDFNKEMKKEYKLYKIFNLITGFRLIKIGGDDL